MSEHEVSEPPTPSTTPPAHTTSTTERGSFCLARCTCGWSGPARRSRDLARTDAKGHVGPAGPAGSA
ncbi:hypothetical protein [Streptomyces sp. NPDC088725]|uniref:hypothetical protein n=1 Tax=Streptomyces sp. NPDC088725 TaxID=3365873 RepID=UPI003825C660